MSVIDPAIQEMIENGRQAVAARDAQQAAEAKAKADAERQKHEAAWNELETAVAQQLPEEIVEYAALDGKGAHSLPGMSAFATVNIPHLAPFTVYLQKGHGGWQIYSYLVTPMSVSGNPLKNAAKFKSNELHLCLAEVARLTEWQATRKAMQLDYEIAVSEWQQEHDAATAVIEAMTNALQKDVCEHYGDSFALWRVHYNCFDDGESLTDTAVVLENETDPLGFWRTVDRRNGAVRRIAYTSVFAIESLGEWKVTKKEYTKRLYGNKLGTIYLPPYVTETELAAAKRALATADAAAPEFPERPRPHDMEAAVLFADWELDWLYHNTGGDAQE